MTASEHIDAQALALAALEDADVERQAAIAHTQECTDCARELERARRLLTYIDALPAPEPISADAFQRIVAAIALDAASERRLPFLRARLANLFATNRVKAWYLTSAIALQLALALFSGTMMLGAEAPLAWLGALVSLAAVPIRIGAYYVIPTPRTSARMLGLLSVCLAGVAVAGLSAPRPELPLALAGLGFASGLYYVFVYSRFGRRRSDRLEVGAPLPSFQLEDESGRPVDARRYVGAPVVFLFFRGNWCPLCMAQIKEIAEHYRELERLGAKVVLISPQPHKYSKALSARFDVSFDFLVDPGARAARELGILHKGGLPAGLELFGYAKDTVLPTVVIADREGRILLSDQTDNYRVRPEPKMFLAVFQRPLTPIAK